MSQHIWRIIPSDNPHEIECIAGYDRPVGSVFVSIIIDDPTSDDDGEYIFDNLSPRQNPTAPRMTVEGVIRTLESLGLPYPDGLRHALTQDQQAQAGNVVKRYGTLSQRDMETAHDGRGT